MQCTRPAAAVEEGIPAGRRRCAAARGRVIARPAGSSPILRGDHEAPGAFAHSTAIHMLGSAHAFEI